MTGLSAGVHRTAGARSRMRCRRRCPNCTLRAWRGREAETADSRWKRKTWSSFRSTGMRRRRVVRPPVVRSTEKTILFGVGRTRTVSPEPFVRGADLRVLRSIATRTGIPAGPEGVKGIRPWPKVHTYERHTFTTWARDLELPVQIARRIEKPPGRTRMCVPVIGDTAGARDRRNILRRRSGPRRCAPDGPTAAPPTQDLGVRGRATRPWASGTPGSPRPNSRRPGDAIRSPARPCRAGKRHPMSSIRSPVVTPCSLKNPKFTSSAPV